MTDTSPSELYSMETGHSAQHIHTDQWALIHLVYGVVHLVGLSIWLETSEMVSDCASATLSLCQCVPGTHHSR